MTIIKLLTIQYHLSNINFVIICILICYDFKVIDNQAKNALTIDLKKFNEIPLKLVATCEQALATRKELIDWFENLKNQEKVHFIFITLPTRGFSNIYVVA